MNTTKDAQAARKIAMFGIVSAIAFACYALFISREHITFCGYAIHLKPMEAETLFIFVDFLAMFGKMLQSKRLSAKTNRIGTKWMIGAGSISLVCNIMAGILQGNYGEAIYGAAIVGLIVALEYTIMNIKAKRTATIKVETATTIVKPQGVRASKKCAAGCTCGKHNRKVRQLPTVTKINGYQAVKV